MLTSFERAKHSYFLSLKNAGEIAPLIFLDEHISDITDAGKYLTFHVMSNADNDAVAFHHGDIL